MPDVGEDATITLTATPYDGSTAASVTVVSTPDGSTPPVLDDPITTDSGHTWTAFLPLTVAGAWKVKWTVTGQGNGIQYDTVYALDPSPAGRTYASLSDLAAYLGAEPDTGAAGMLIRATRRIDYRLRGAVYPVTTDGESMPTLPVNIAALRDAVCAQVEWWDEQGDTTGSGVSAGYGSMSIGNVSIGRSGAAGGSSAAAAQAEASGVSPIAEEILLTAGMLPINPWMLG